MHPRQQSAMPDRAPALVRLRALTITRVIAALALLAVGAVHLQAYAVEHYSVIPTIGPLFLLNFIGATVLGLYFLVPASASAGRVRRLLDTLAALAGCGLAAGAFVGLLISEHTPLFGFMEHGYRFAIVFALTSEGVAIVMLSALLLMRRAVGRQARGSRNRWHAAITSTPASSPTRP
jgi:hypothetical protein